ncbi:MAG TPA: phosphotransferase family protein [Chloroflexia bacterium]|nr:phosphotransferase family protein [Chloroflexia bacterium]
MTVLPPLVDEQALAQYLAVQLPGENAGAAITTERISGGHSNETFIIRRGEGVTRETWVLRRPPRGPLLPTAHDVGREYRVINALHKTDVPVPAPILFCSDESIIGAPFYLMQYIPGVVVRKKVPEAFARPQDRAAMAEELIQTLVKLHAVDWRAIGLENLGKPEGYLERQLKRWTGQLDKSRHRPLPELDAVSEWLRLNLPESPPATLVHGDYRIDNVIYTAEPPAQILGVLDWEMATIGDPLADLGYLLSHWREAGDPPVAVTSELADVTEQPGFPTRAQLAERYRELSGRAVKNLNFYEALAIWKLAILLEGNYVRYLAGTTDDHFYALLDEGVPALARRALEVTQRADYGE